MKLHLKHSLNLCLVVSALLLTSCGKKENKVSSGISGSSPFYTGNTSLNTSAGSTIVNQVQSIKSSMTCLNGYRLTNDVSFYAQGAYINANRITGNWTSGFSLNGGSINKMWIGVSAFRDLMFVTQVMNGSSVVGFNVTISFCEMKNPSGGASIVSNERQLTNFLLSQSGIYLNGTAACGYNFVNLAETSIVSQRDPSNPLSPGPATIPTTFAPPRCN